MFCLLVGGPQKGFGPFAKQKSIQKSSIRCKYETESRLCFAFSCFWNPDNEDNFDCWLLLDWYIGTGINFFGMLKVSVSKGTNKIYEAVDLSPGN